MENRPIVLTYHEIVNGGSKYKYALSSQQFLAHMEFLYRNNYRTFTADELYQVLKLGSELPAKSIIITFDDGHESNFHTALPILLQFEFTATFFITTDWIGTPGSITLEQLRHLSRVNMSIQSHSVTHNFLNNLSINDLYYELKESKEVLERILEKQVSYLSLPGGRYNKTVIEVAKHTGYLAIFTSLPFTVMDYNGIVLIGRQGVKSSLGSRSLTKLLQRSPYLMAKISILGRIKSSIQKTLGDSFYHFIWKKYSHK